MYGRCELRAGGRNARAVGGHGLQHRARADVVVGGEGKPAVAGHLGALAPAAAEDPHLDVRALPGHDVRLGAVGRPIASRRAGRGCRRSVPVVLRGLRRSACCSSFSCSAKRGDPRRAWAKENGGGIEQRHRRRPCSPAGRRRRRRRQPPRARCRPSGRGRDRCGPGCSASRIPNCSTTDSGSVVPHQHRARAHAGSCAWLPRSAWISSGRRRAGHARVEVVLGQPVAAGSRRPRPRRARSTLLPRASSTFDPCGDRDEIEDGEGDVHLVPFNR